MVGFLWWMKFGDGDRRIARQGHASCQCVDERGGICILADPARLACVLWCGLLIISLAGPEAMFIPFALAVSFSFTLAISIPVSVSIVRVFGSDSVFLTFPFPISSPVRTVVAGLRRAQGMLAGPFDGFLVGGGAFLGRVFDQGCLFRTCLCEVTDQKRQGLRV